jgi:hypothetical protein
MVATNDIVSQVPIVQLVLFRLTQVTGTTHCTLQVAVFHHTTVVQVIIVLQLVTYVTNQLALTVATEGLELDQVTFLFVVVSGLNIGVNCNVCQDQTYPVL